MRQRGREKGGRKVIKDEEKTLKKKKKESEEMVTREDKTQKKKEVKKETAKKGIQGEMIDRCWVEIHYMAKNMRTHLSTWFGHGFLMKGNFNETYFWSLERDVKKTDDRGIK